MIVSSLQPQGLKGRSPIIGSVLYAGLGVMCAEFFLLGIRQITHFEMSRIVVELSLFFIACVIWLDPLSTFFKVHIDRSVSRPGRARFSSGIIGLALALVFVGFNLTVDGAFRPNGTSAWLYLFVHAVMPWLIPGAVTFAWVVGSHKPYRAALYGALAGFFSDALVRLILSAATGSILDNYAHPVQASAGGLQAAFYAGAGGLVIDLARSQRPLRNLALGLFGAIGLWTLGYYLLGRATGMPEPDLAIQFGSMIVRLVDYSGWILGLALYPNFAASFQNAKTFHGHSSTMLLRAVLFAPAVITCDILILVVGFHGKNLLSAGNSWGYALAIMSGLAWQLGTITTFSKDVWGRFINVFAGLCAIGSAAFLYPS